jgi:hypothetical protein
MRELHAALLNSVELGDSDPVIELPPFKIPTMDGPTASRKLETFATAFFNRLEGYFRAQDWRQDRVEELHSEFADRLDASDERARKALMKKLASLATHEAKRKFGKSMVAPRFQAAGSAGLGKTRIIKEEYRKRPELWTKQIWYFAPTIILGRAFVDKLNEDAPIGMPAARVMPGRTFEDDDTRPACKRSVVVNDAHGHVSSIYKSFCDDGKGRVCPFYGDCEYIALRRDRGPGIRAFAHAYLTLPQSGELALEPPDFVIVDESCQSAFIKQSRANVAMVSDLQTYLPSDPAQTDYEPAYKSQDLGNYVIEVIMEHPDFMQTFMSDETNRMLARKQADPSCKPFDTLDPESVANRLTAAAAVIDAAQEQPDISPTDTDEMVREKLTRLRRKSGRSVSALFRQIARDISSGSGRSYAIEPIDENHQDARHVVAGKHFVPHVLCHGLRDLTFKESVPLLVIDADAILEVNRRFFSRTPRKNLLRGVTIRALRRGMFLQCFDQTFSRKGLVDDSPVWETPSETYPANGLKARRKRITNFAVESAGPGKHVLIVMSKKVRRAIVGDRIDASQLYFQFDDRVEITHFGAFIGQNRWSKFDIAIIVGREQPPPLSMEREARAIYGNAPGVGLELSGRYVDARRAYGPNASLSMPFDTHADPRVRALLERTREGQICQAIDRLRLLSEDDRDPLCVVLCNLPLPGIVPELKRASDILDGGTRIERAIERGFITTNAKVLAAVHPELWNTAKAAEHTLARADSETPTALIDTILLLAPRWFLIGEFRVVAPGVRKWSKFAHDPLQYPDPEQTKRSSLSLAGDASIEFRMADGAVRTDPARVAGVVETVASTIERPQHPLAGSSTASRPVDRRPKGLVLVFVRAEDAAALLKRVRGNRAPVAIAA